MFYIKVYEKYLTHYNKKYDWSFRYFMTLTNEGTTSIPKHFMDSILKKAKIVCKDLKEKLNSKKIILITISMRVVMRSNFINPKVLKLK